MSRRDKKKAMQRKYIVSLAEKEDFERYLKDYLDNHYDTYINGVIGRYKEIQKKYGNSLDIEGLFNLVNLEEIHLDKKLYDHLAGQGVFVRNKEKFSKIVRIFSKVIVEEAWPKILADYRKIQPE